MSYPGYPYHLNSGSASAEDSASLLILYLVRYFHLWHNQLLLGLSLFLLILVLINVLHAALSMMTADDSKFSCYTGSNSTPASHPTMIICPYSTQISKTMDRPLVQVQLLVQPLEQLMMNVPPPFPPHPQFHSAPR